MAQGAANRFKAQIKALDEWDLIDVMGELCLRRGWLSVLQALYDAYAEYKETKI